MATETMGTSPTALVAMLRDASELEHMLTCEYLYAAFTLKKGGDAGLTPSGAARTAHWNQQITKIAAQEMYHLMLASNLLTAIGAKPFLSHENFPQPGGRFADIKLPSMLAPCDAQTVHRFMCWEKPAETDWWDEECLRCAEDVNARTGLAPTPDQPSRYPTIAALYEEIDATLKANPTWINPAYAPKQVTTGIVPFSPAVSPITTYDEAHTHIEEIIREGEGTPAWDSQSHFAFFHQMHDDMTDAANPVTSPAWASVDNPAYVANPAPPSGASLITDPTGLALGLLFNDAYLLLVLTLMRLFNPDGETPEQRQTLGNAAMVFMPLVIKELGTVLTRTPAGSAYPGKFAGPSFELPHQLPPPEGPAKDAWASLHDRMITLTTNARVVSLKQPELELVASHLETILPLFVLDAEEGR